MIPGSNLLNQALRLIRPIQIQYFAATGRQKNGARQFATQYAAPVMIQASVQAVNRAKYHFMGLDLQKNYVKVWAPANIINLDRDRGSDKFIVNSVTYVVDDNNNWFLQDGWVSCLAIAIPSGTPT